MRRTCAGCRRSCPNSKYSSDQWQKGDGVSLCISCAPKSADYNMRTADWGCSDGRLKPSRTGDVTVNEIIADGTFRYVAKGVYNVGPRQGEPCVLKWNKPTFGTLEDTFYALDFEIAYQAFAIVKEFNKRNSVGKIRVNIPVIYYLNNKEGSGSRANRKPVLGEPFIENYQKWNDKYGGNHTPTKWGKIMQALSHFSYHTSRGKRVLCDLQGGIKGDEAIITQPAFLSRNGEYGGSDLGQDGIIKFFSHHVCSKYCSSSWIKPDNPTQGSRLVSHTYRTANNPATTRSVHMRFGPTRVGSMGTVPMMRTAHAWTEPLQTEPTLAARRGAMHQRHRQLFDQHFGRDFGPHFDDFGQDFDERHRRFLDNFHRYVGDFNRRFDNFNRHFDQLWEEMA
jgi:hypothetical protein